MAIHPSFQQYFDTVEAAFLAQERSFESESAWARRHNVLYAVAAHHLEKLRKSFQCWRSACHFRDRFRIDTNESGLPSYAHVAMLDNDARIFSPLGVHPTAW